ncbi:MAG: MarR family winged helix-turn-helix transcriptional regulator [Betaproteobacteria bacterium]
MVKSYDFRKAPAHLIRRTHQIAMALFMEESADADITPVQFAVLNALMDEPGQDQVSLSARVAFDAATSGSVIGRLEAKGWVRRQPDEHDRRRKRLWVTSAGCAVVAQVKRGAAKTQRRLLAPLDAQEREHLVALLAKVVDGHQGLDPFRR